jgi:uncharacterized protein YeaO (DUF488 family)
MAIRIVRLGTPKQRGEGLRLGTVRRPPRGVRRDRYAAEDWFDVWLPSLAPSAPLMAAYHRNDGMTWERFAARYESEMARAENSRLLDVLAAFSHAANFSVGCYCEDERRCHRGILRRVLTKHGADVAGRVSSRSPFALRLPVTL